MEGTHEVGWRPFMPASTLSGRSVALLRVRLDGLHPLGRPINFPRKLRKIQIYLIPARLEECTIEDRLADRQWVDLFAAGGYEKLVEALRFVGENQLHSPDA